MTNSSPPIRAMVSVSRTSPRSRSATIFSSLSPAGWPNVSLTALNWSRSRWWTATISSPLDARSSACSSRSFSSTRLARSVSASWCAMCSILISDRRCSVMSSWVATQPRSGIGRWRILKVRPLRSSTMLSVASADTATLVRQCRYSSRDIAGKLPASNRMSTISVKRRARADAVGRKVVHLDVAIVADDQPMGGVEEAQSLRHVVDRGVELQVADPQGSLPAPCRARIASSAARSFPRAR